MPSTVALRFRDLIGPTIERHTALIEGDPGYAWWAWWSKPNEQVPLEVFGDFHAEIQENGSMEVFLADSGRHRMYRARVEQIEYSEDGQSEHESPEPDATPEYYRETEHKAWLKLSEIEEIEDPSGELEDWSYDEVEEFFEEPEIARSRHHMDAFDGKQVSSLEEMLARQHRTIYFLREFQEGDSTREIRLTAPNAPRPYLTDPIIAESNYILHLSDVHFSQDDHHRFPTNEEGLGQTLAARIEDTLGDRLGPPAAVVISGDLTWTGDEDEFESARAFVDALHRRFGLDQNQFLIVPGNHDIRWAPPEDVEDDPTTEVEFPADEAEQNYRQFWQDVFDVPPEDDLSMGRRIVLDNYFAVDLVGFNSSRLEQREFAGFGYIGADQLGAAPERMGWMGEDPDPPADYRFAFLHHHLLPVLPTQVIEDIDARYSLTLDATQVLHKLAESGVHLVGHGHMHQPSSISISRGSTGGAYDPARSLVIHATGSAGVGPEHQGPIGANAFTTYSVTSAGIELRVWTLGQNHEAFEEDRMLQLVDDGHGGMTFAADEG